MSEERIIVVPFLDAFGGVERLVVGLCRYLRACGVAHRIVCLRASIDLAEWAGWPIEVEEVRAARHSLAEAWALRRRLQGANDVLFFDLKGAFYAGLAMGGRYHVHLTDPPSLLPRDVSKHAPSLSYELSSDMVRAELAHRLNRRGVRRAKTVIAMTNAIARELQTLYSVEPVVLRPGVRSMPVAVREPSRHLLSLSRLEPNKRIDWILRAVAALPDRDFVLDIVGEGSQRSALEALAAELGIAANTRFHGRVSDEAVEQLWARCGLFLMPAVQGYGLPALESLARRVPVVLHRDSGVAEILGDTPWVAIIDDAASLAPALARMAGVQTRPAVPIIPTEEGWAQQLSAACGWITPTGS